MAKIEKKKSFKIETFQLKKKKIDIFAQLIDCDYMLEPPTRGVGDDKENIEM